MATSPAKSRYLAALRDHSPVEKGRAKVLQSASPESPHYRSEGFGVDLAPPPPPPGAPPTRGRAPSPRPRSATPPPPRPEDEMPRRGTSKLSNHLASRWISAVGSAESPDRGTSDKENSKMSERDIASAESNGTPKARGAHEIAAMFERTPPPPPPPPPLGRLPSPTPESGMKRRNNSSVHSGDLPQLMHQKKQWDANKDIPRGTIRNSPFTPVPEVPPPQLMHQKNQWDANRDIPRGMVAEAVRSSANVSPPRQSPPKAVSPMRKTRDQWTTAKGSPEEDPPQTRHQHKQWDVKSHIPPGVVQSSPFGKKEFFKDGTSPRTSSPRKKAWGDLGIEEVVSHDSGTQYSERIRDSTVPEWSLDGDPTLSVSASKSHDTWSGASPLSSPTSKHSMSSAPSDEEGLSPVKYKRDVLNGSRKDTPSGKVRGMANKFEESMTTQSALSAPTEPPKADLPGLATNKEVDDDGFLVGSSTKEVTESWIISDTPSSQLFPANDEKWGASAAASPGSNDWDDETKDWFQSTSFGADTKEEGDAQTDHVSATVSPHGSRMKAAAGADATSTTTDNVLESTSMPNIVEKGSSIANTASDVEAASVADEGALKDSKRGKKKRGFFKLFGGGKKNKKKEKSGSNRSDSAKGDGSVQVMPTSSAASSFISASKDGSEENLEMPQAVTDQQNLPDTKEVDGPAKDKAPTLSVADDSNQKDSAPKMKGNLDESRPSVVDSDTLAYARSLDDTTVVSEMTNPTVFQSRPPVEEDAGVLQETSGNIGSDNSGTQVSTDAEKSKSGPDPFDASSSVFSSGDPFGAPAVRPGRTLTSESTSFNDTFFTSLQSQPSLASKSQADSFLDAQSKEFSEDPPLDVVDMGSSDEEDNSGKARKRRSRQEQTLSRRTGKIPPKEAGKELNAQRIETKKIAEGAVDDPPLESVDMDSSDDEAPESTPTITPGRVVALDSPANPILTKVKERKKARQEKLQEDSVTVDSTTSADTAPRSSSSPRQMHPAAEAIGRSSSQRARILAKQRKGRVEPAGITTSDRPRRPQRDRTSVTAHSFPSENKTRDVLKSSGPRTAGSAVTTNKAQQADVVDVNNGEDSARTMAQDEVMTPVKPQRGKTYAVERPRSILKKPRRALPTEPSLYTPYENITDPMQLAGLRLLAAAVIPIQAAMRMFLARRERLNRMWGVIVIQSNMRRCLCQRNFITTVDAVIAIQKTYRGWLARDQVEDKHYCATQIQRILRGYIATLSVYESIYKVTLVQSFVRMKLAIDEATYRMALIIQVQSIIRGYLVRKRIEVASTSATLIQAAWRGYYSCMIYQYDVLDIIIAQSLVRRRAAVLNVQKKRQDRMDRSATLIQSQWRSYDCTMNYLHYLADVLIVQSAVRRWQAMKLYRTKAAQRNEDHARKEEEAAIEIQRTWRGFVCYADYMFTVSDIVVVQSQVRCWLAARRKARMHQDREIHAAIDIQRHWRGSLGRDEAIMRLIEVIICQGVIRRFLAQREYSRRREQMIIQKARVASLFDASSSVGHEQYDAAVVIQKQMRGMIVRDELTRNSSAQKIQTQWRGFLPRLTYCQYRAAVHLQTLYRMKKYFVAYKRYMAARRIQMAWRYTRDRSAYIQYLAAVCIQSVYRGVRARGAYQQYRAATAIQTAYRGGRVRADYTRYRAATAIQSAWRGKLVHAAFIIIQVERLAATLIQTAWRRFICHTDYIIMLNDVITVQAVARQRQARMEVAAMRQEKAEFIAAQNVQRSFRGYQGRAKARNVRAYIENERTCQAAAVCIQQSWRGYEQRQKYGIALESASQIQAHARGMFVRDQLTREHLAATKIQSVARGNVVATDYKQYSAARCIQTAWRCKLAQIAYMVYQAEKLAATLIQAAWRGFVGRTDYLLTMNDIVVAQKMARRLLARKNVAAVRQEKAALNIQRSFRGYKGRSAADEVRSYLEYEWTREVGAICIQRTWRGYEQRQKYGIALESASQIQAHARGMFVRDQLTREHLAATKIQSVARGNMVATDYKQYSAARCIQTAWRSKFAQIAYIVYQAEKLAATLIQAAWRGFVGRTDYLLMMNDIVIAQNMARRLLARKKVTAMRQEKATLEIQRSFRGYKGRSTANLVRLHLENDKACQAAAANIQRTWRGYDQRQKYSFALGRASQIQAIARGMIVRDQLVREHAAATKIQTLTRGRFTRIAYLVYQAECVAALMIQTAWRTFVCYTDYIFTLGDILMVQKIARRYIASRRVAAIRQKKAEVDSAITLQRSWRGFSQQQRYWYLLGCTLQIQRAMRGIMFRDRLAADHAAATKIQTAVRRSQAMTGYKNKQMTLMAVAATGTLAENEIAVRKIEIWWQKVFTARSLREEEAAVVLQQWSRSHALAMKLHNYALETIAAVMIQRWWRLVLYFQYELEEEAAAAIQLQWRVRSARMTRKEILHEQDEAACTIQRFFLMVKAMVDREIRAEKKRRKRKKMYKKFHAPEMEDALLESVWSDTVKPTDSTPSESRRTSSSRVPMQEGAATETLLARTDSRSKRRLAQLSSEVAKEMDDASGSVASHHTGGSSMYHVPPPRRSKLSRKDLDEDIALEEAWIDTEINIMKERGITSSKRRSSSKRQREPSKQRRSSRGDI